MTASSSKIARGVVGSVAAAAIWVVLARMLFGLVNLHDLAGAGGRIWLGLVLVASALCAWVTVVVARTGQPSERGAGALAFTLSWPGSLVVTAALLIGALTTTTLADRFADGERMAAAEQAGRYLVDRARDLPPTEATALLRAHATLGPWTAVFIAPSGVAFPEELATQSASWPAVELPLEGSLLGGQLRVAWRPTGEPHLPIILLSVAALILALAHAARASWRVAHEVEEVARQVSAVASETSEAGAAAARPSPPLTLTELRRLTTSTNRLLEGVPRLTMASFVAIERANEAQRFKSQFLANMSHDLRSPLNSILGFSELLLRGLEGELAEAQKPPLSAIHARGLALLRLLGEILDTAKAESGRMELKRQSTSPAELVQQALSEVRRTRAAPTADLTGSMPVALDRLRIELQPGLAAVYVDPLRMQQALAHLFNHLIDAPGEAPFDLRLGDQLVEEGPLRKRYLVMDVPLPDGSVTEADLVDGFRSGAAAPTSNSPTNAPANASLGGLHLALPLARRLAAAHGGELILTPPDVEGFRHLRLRVPSGDQSPIQPRSGPGLTLSASRKAPARTPPEK